ARREAAGALPADRAAEQPERRDRTAGEGAPRLAARCHAAPPEPRAQGACRVGQYQPRLPAPADSRPAGVGAGGRGATRGGGAVSATRDAHMAGVPALPTADPRAPRGLLCYYLIGSYA